MSTSPILARIQWLRKPAADISALTLRNGEAALVTDEGTAVLGDGETAGGKWVILLVDLDGLTEGDMVQFRSGRWVRVARQAAVDDVDATALPGESTISSLTFSGTYDAAEVEALRDECQALRDSLAATQETVDTLLAALRVTGGAGLLQDS